MVTFKEISIYKRTVLTLCKSVLCNYDQVVFPTSGPIDAYGDNL